MRTTGSEQDEEVSNVAGVLMPGAGQDGSVGRVGQGAS